MITSSDIKRLIEAFKTRTEVDEDVIKIEEKLDFKFQDVLTKLDSVYKELKDMRLEQDMHVQKHRDIDDTLEKLQSASP